jgi:hypothetical protein
LEKKAYFRESALDLSRHRDLKILPSSNYHFVKLVLSFGCETIMCQTTD